MTWWPLSQATALVSHVYRAGWFCGFYRLLVTTALTLSSCASTPTEEVAQKCLVTMPMDEWITDTTERNPSITIKHLIPKGDKVMVFIVVRMVVLPFMVTTGFLSVCSGIVGFSTGFVIVVLQTLIFPVRVQCIRRK